MNSARLTRVVALAGIVTSIAVAVVAYRMRGNGHGAAWCLVGFGIGEYLSWQYPMYCTAYQCPAPGEDGHLPCIDRCFIKFIIFQLLLLIGLLTCLLATLVQW